MVSPRYAALRVRYGHRAMWLAFGVSALNLLVAALGAPSINLILGVLFALLGALYSTRTHFTYTPELRRFEVIAPFVPRRTFQAGERDEVVVEDGRIYLLRAEGGRERLPVSRWLSRRPEWEAVVWAIGEPAPARED